MPFAEIPSAAKSVSIFLFSRKYQSFFRRAEKAYNDIAWSREQMTTVVDPPPGAVPS
jgi:hypothetical protein